MVETKELRAWRNHMPPITEERRHTAIFQIPDDCEATRVHVTDANDKLLSLEKLGRNCRVNTKDAVLPLTVDVDGETFHIASIENIN